MGGGFTRSTPESSGFLISPRLESDSGFLLSFLSGALMSIREVSF